MQLPATIPVTVAYELYGLDANLRPGELILAARRQWPDFPYLDTALVKQGIKGVALHRPCTYRGALFYLQGAAPK